jgi:hypothetical protein
MNKRRGRGPAQNKIFCNYIMDANFQSFLSIMAFYIFLSYIVFPAGFYYLAGKSLASAGNGFVVGSIVSLALWFAVGKKMVK